MVRGHSWLYSKSGASLGYMIPKNKIKFWFIFKLRERERIDPFGIGNVQYCPCEQSDLFCDF